MKQVAGFIGMSQKNKGIQQNQWHSGPPQGLLSGQTKAEQGTSSQQAGVNQGENSKSGAVVQRKMPMRRDVNSAAQRQHVRRLVYTPYFPNETWNISTFKNGAKDVERSVISTLNNVAENRVMDNCTSRVIFEMTQIQFESLPDIIRNEFTRVGDDALKWAVPEDLKSADLDHMMVVKLSTEGTIYPTTLIFPGGCSGMAKLKSVYSFLESQLERIVTPTPSVSLKYVTSWAEHLFDLCSGQLINSQNERVDKLLGYMIWDIEKAITLTDQVIACYNHPEVVLRRLGASDIACAVLAGESVVKLTRLALSKSPVDGCSCCRILELILNLPSRKPNDKVPQVPLDILFASVYRYVSAMCMGRVLNGRIDASGIQSTDHATASIKLNDIIVNDLELRSMGVDKTSSFRGTQSMRAFYVPENLAGSILDRINVLVMRHFGILHMWGFNGVVLQNQEGYCDYHIITGLNHLTTITHTNSMVAVHWGTESRMDNIFEIKARTLPTASETMITLIENALKEQLTSIVKDGLRKGVSFSVKRNINDSRFGFETNSSPAIFLKLRDMLKRAKPFSDLLSLALSKVIKKENAMIQRSITTVEVAVAIKMKVYGLDEYVSLMKVEKKEVESGSLPLQEFLKLKSNAAGAQSSTVAVKMKEEEVNSKAYCLISETIVVNMDAVRSACGVVQSENLVIKSELSGPELSESVTSGLMELLGRNAGPSKSWADQVEEAENEEEKQKE
ncbi:polypeptide Pns4 [Wound tumor virus]|uniref:Non-structural protein 4 n=1 Tax=Wound tumor virus TaxID=10987 RepID=NSP4_WTV|nr:polypeptide Pns4 [Wound tumor virus]P13091.1 RecName: Full=Non-structural protein 4; Short=Pns4 [Wound tumor virus]AAA48506.1 polypeptide Pns4 [Wound tumor virus]